MPALRQHGLLGVARGASWGLRRAALSAGAQRGRGGRKGGVVREHVAPTSHWRRTDGRTDRHHHPHATLTLRPAHTNTVHVCTGTPRSSSGFLSRTPGGSGERHRNRRGLHPQGQVYEQGN